MQDRVVKNYIGGKWIDLHSGRLQPVHNPATGETLAQVCLSTAADVEDAVQAVQRASG